MKLNKEKIGKMISFLSLLFLPMMVFAESDSGLNFFGAVMFEAFVSIHMSIFVLIPYSKIKSNNSEEQKKIFWKAFWIRACVLIFLDFFIPSVALVLDFFMIFLGAFILIPMSKSKANLNNAAPVSAVTNIVSNASLTNCPKCNAVIVPGNKFCIECGESLAIVSANVEALTCPQCKRKLPPGNHFCIHCGQSVEVSEAIVNNVPLKCLKCHSELKVTDVYCPNCANPTNFITTNLNHAMASGVVTIPSANDGVPIDFSHYQYVDMTEDQMLNTMIEDELVKNGESNKISVSALEKKKNIFSIVYGIILFICISLLFFHTKTGAILFVLFVATVVYFCNVKKYNIVEYLKKEVKLRPDEKINYIVSSVVSGKVHSGGNKFLRLVIFLVAVIIPLFIFKTPHMIFEKQDEGYVVRFYTMGLTNNDKVLEIPDEYKGEPVVGIRGDVFANVFTIQEVILPDTIKEIRGGAFKGATSLRKINLPDGIAEIKGNTFENCYSLEEITIPDSVVRIGGHAFRNDSSLETVNISSDSQLEEIGSSAFRNCTSLNEIILPKGVSINERAFKESPTTVREYTNNYVSSSGASSGSTSSGATTSAKDDYEYNRFLYLTLGERQLVNAYRTNAVTQDYYIELVKVEESRTNDYTYVLNISKASGGSHSFLLFEGQSTYVDNEYGIAVECVNSYYFTSYNESIGVNIYFN